MLDHDVEGRTDSDLDIVVMDCILAQTDKPPKVKLKHTTAKLVDTPVKVSRYELDPSKVDDNYDAGRGKPLDPGEILLHPFHLKDDEYYRALWCGRCSA